MISDVGRYRWLLLLAVVSGTAADITGTNPAAGTCLCFTGKGVRVRNPACGTILGSANVGECYIAKGHKKTCQLSGKSYEFFKIDYDGKDGWSAGDYLQVGSAGQCGEPTTTTTTTTISPQVSCSDAVIVKRNDWGARPPRNTKQIQLPVSMMFIHHTAGAPCSSLHTCSARVREIQNYHMDTKGWWDIGYNWLVGEDGRIYEGRGWDVVGAHTSGFNSVSHSVSVMGNFMEEVPNMDALNAVKAILACGVEQGKITSVYELFGHRDASNTDCPGAKLYEEIETWLHFSNRPLK